MHNVTLHNVFLELKYWFAFCTEFWLCLNATPYLREFHLTRVFAERIPRVKRGITVLRYIRFWNVTSRNLGPLPPLVTQCHTSSTPLFPLTCDVIYEWPLNEMFEKLIIIPSCSPWSSLIWVVPQKNGRIGKTKRLIACDFKKLTKQRFLIDIEFPI